jgi:hypothetical protein
VFLPGRYQEALRMMERNGTTNEIPKEARARAMVELCPNTGVGWEPHRQAPFKPSPRIMTKERTEKGEN